MVVGIWQLLLLMHIVLFVIGMILLINFKTSFVNKVLWALFMFLIPWIGSISFLIWRNYQLKR